MQIYSWHHFSQVNDKLHFEPSKYLGSFYCIWYFTVIEILVTLDPPVICLRSPDFHQWHIHYTWIIIINIMSKWGSISQHWFTKSFFVGIAPQIVIFASKMGDIRTLTLWGPADISAATPCAQAILAKNLPLLHQHRHLPLTKSTKTELQRIDTPVPVPEPACRCHLKRTDDRQTEIETCNGSSRMSRGISWLGISSYKPSRIIPWLGLKELS
jgi:hypothetical protein